MDNSLSDYDNIADRHDSREDTGIITGVRYRPLTIVTANLIIGTQW